MKVSDNRRGAAMDSRPPWEVFEEVVLPRLTVETVFANVAKGKRSGRGFTGLCPFHEDRDPSFSVFDVDRLLWKCHAGCGGGDAVRFVMRRRGVEWMDAARELASLAGVDEATLETWRTKWTSDDWRRHEEKERKGSLLAVFFEGAQAALEGAQAALEGAAGAAALGYMKGRGFASFASFGLFTTRADVKARLASFTDEELEASGLLADGRWEGRLVIPWRDARGRLASFVARDLMGTVDGSKYLNLKGTKKDELVALGLDVALRSGGKEDLVLVEGPMDALLLQARGFENVASLQGTATSPGTFEGLARLGVRSVTLVLDNDEAGRKATISALENATKGSNVPVVYVVDPAELGDAKDPDELVRKRGLAAFREVLTKAVSGAVYLGTVHLQGVTPESPDRERREAVDRVLDATAGPRGSRSALEHEDLLRMTAERTGYSFEALAGLAEDHAARRHREEKEKKLRAALTVAQSAMGQGKDLQETARELSGALASLQAKDEPLPPTFSVDAVWEEMKKTPAGRRSGWDAVDELGVRFNAGELAIVGGRTGHAKTTVLVGLLFNWLKTATEDELFVFYSAEEPVVPVTRRLLSLLTVEAGAAWSSDEIRDYVRDPYSRGEDYGWSGSPEALESARARLREWESRLLVVYRPTWPVDKLAAHARSVAEGRKVGAVLVDYLQRIPPPEGPHYDRRDIQVSMVGRYLKELSVALDAPVVAGAQISRKPTENLEGIHGMPYREATSAIRNARPDLQHLREGGSEQEADLVLGLLNYVADYRTEASPSPENTPPDVTLLEVGVLKNRDGEMGRWAGLAFERRYRRVRDAEPHEEEALEVETRRARAPKRTAEQMAESEDKRARAAEARATSAKEKTEQEREKTRRAELKAASKKEPSS